MIDKRLRSSDILDIDEQQFGFQPGKSTLHYLYKLYHDILALKKPVNNGTTDEISKMKVDLETTMNSVKTLVDDFYYFMNGTNVKNGVTPESKDNETSTWKTQPTVARPLKEISLEAGAEQKKRTR